MPRPSKSPPMMMIMFWGGEQSVLEVVVVCSKTVRLRDWVWLCQEVYLIIEKRHCFESNNEMKEIPENKSWKIENFRSI